MSTDFLPGFSSTEVTTSGFKPEVATESGVSVSLAQGGSAEHPPLATPRGSGDAENLPIRLVANHETPPLSLAAFRAQQAVLRLTPAERATVARRTRFHTMPWLHLAGQDGNANELP